MANNPLEAIIVAGFHGGLDLFQGSLGLSKYIAVLFQGSNTSATWLQGSFLMPVSVVVTIDLHDLS